MATEQETIALNLEDGISDTLAKILGKLDSFGGKADESETKSIKAGKGASFMAAKFAAFGLVATGVEKALGLLSGGVQQVTALMSEALMVANRYQGAEAQLDAGLRASAKSAETYNATKAKAIKLSRELSLATGVEETEIQTLIARQLQLGLSYQESAENASLALDIMARKGIELKDASEKLAKVRRGEVGDLAELIDLTKREQEALEKMTSSSARTARMMELVRERFAGAKGEIQSSEVAVKNLQNAKNALTAEVGKLIDESGLYQAVLSPLTDAIYKQADATASNKKQTQLYALSLGADVIPILAKFALSLNMVYTLAEQSGVGLKMLGVLGESAAAVVGSSAALMGVALGTAMAQINDLQAKALQTAADAAEFLGKDDVAKALRTWGDGAAASAKVIRDNVEDLEHAHKGYIMTITDTGSELEKVTKQQDVMLQASADRIRGIESLERQALERIDKAKSAVEARDDTRRKAAVKGETVRAKLAGDAKALDAQGVALVNAQLKTAQERVKLQAMLTEGERINQRAVVARAELEERLLGIQDKRIREQTKIAELARIEAERQDAVIKLADEVHKRDIARGDVLRAQEAEREAHLQRALDSTAALQAQLNALGDTKGIRGLGAGLATVTGSISDARKVMREFAVSSKAGGQAAASALANAGKGAAGFAQALGASATTQAVILAAFEQAAAIASFAVGDIVSGAQHQAAAIAFGSVAAMSASGGGGAKGGGGGSSGGAAAAAATGGSTTGREAREGAEMLADALADKLGGSKGGVYFDMRGATILDENAWFDRMQQAFRDNGVALG